MRKIIIAAVAGLLAASPLTAAVARGNFQPSSQSAAAPAAVGGVIVIQANDTDVLPAQIDATKGDTIVFVHTRAGAHESVKVIARSRVGQTTFVLHKIANTGKLTSPADEAVVTFIANRPGTANLIVHKHKQDGWHLERIEVNVR